MEEENKVNEVNESQNTVKDFTYPSFMGRAGAYIFDGLILSPVFVLLFFVQGKLYTNESMFYTALKIELLFFIIPICYKIYFNTKFSGTPGKLFFKFKIIREDRKPMTVETAIKRDAIYIIRSAIYLTCFFAFIAFFSMNREKITTYGVATYLYSETLLAKIETCIFFVICIFDLGKALFSKKRKALHDTIAGTVVVYQPV